MQKTITKIFLFFVFLTSIGSINAQTVLWPSATDTNQIKASKFTGGMNGWTTVGISSDSIGFADSAIWVWDIDTIYMRKGAYFGATTRIGFDKFSPSYADGYMCFNSDYLDNRGIRGNFGKGPCPSSHSGELISPLINLAGINDYRISFAQGLRYFNTTYSISWSEDGGTTWKTPIVINAGVTGQSNVPVTLALPGSIGTNKVRVKFIFSGDYYFWCVDDVKIIKVSNDMKINTDFLCYPVNRKTPITQIDPLFFQSDISNVGVNKATNVKLRANIYNSSNAIVFSKDKLIGTLNAGDTAQNAQTFIPTLWTPPSTIANYRGSYRILQDSTDDVPFNDSIVFNYEVTDTVFAKENGTSNGIRPGVTAGEKIIWKYGNAYHITKSGWYRTSASVSLVTNATGVKTTNCANWLYRFIGDTNRDGNIGSDERERIAFGEFVIPNVLSNYTIFNTKMSDYLDDNIKCVKLDTGTYLLMFEFTGNSALADDESLFMGVSTVYDYRASRFIADSLLGRTRLHNIISGSTSKDIWATGIFLGGQRVPYARLNITPTSPPSQGCKDLVATSDLLGDENKLSIFPNPVADNDITISVDLAKQSKNATIEIYDIAGKFMSSMKLNNVKKDNYTINVRDLSNGSYFLKLTTEEGNKSVQFNVQR